MFCRIGASEEAHSPASLSRAPVRLRQWATDASPGRARSPGGFWGSRDHGRNVAMRPWCVCGGKDAGGHRKEGQGLLGGRARRRWAGWGWPRRVAPSIQPCSAASGAKQPVGRSAGHDVTVCWLGEVGWKKQRGHQAHRRPHLQDWGFTGGQGTPQPHSPSCRRRRRSCCEEGPSGTEPSRSPGPRCRRPRHTLGPSPRSRT